MAKGLSAMIFALLVALLAASAATGVRADCECGYTTTVGNYSQPSLFTDMLETNFYQTDDPTKHADWILPAFNVTKEQTHGHFGLSFEPGNILGVPVVKTPTAKNTGLELFVNSGLDENMVSVSELDTKRSDMRYGSYRASIKLTEVAGTCAAFIWYFNGTQEIDMEFLSKDFNVKTGTFPVNLIVQSPKADDDGYDAAKDGNYVRVDLPFDPTKDFHEYRFDFVPGEVHFSADGKALAKIKGSAVPTDAGHLTLQHWSNGNDVWSGGPPSKDTSITVRYVKAYFNSTDTTRQSEWNKKCTGSGPKSICPIGNPPLAGSKGKSDGKGEFDPEVGSGKPFTPVPEEGTNNPEEEEGGDNPFKHNNIAVTWGPKTPVMMTWGMFWGVILLVL